MRVPRFAVPLIVLWIPLLSTTAPAQQDPPATPPAAEPAGEPTLPAAASLSSDAMHDEIRRVRDDILAAIGRGDVDGVLAHLHPNVVFTPMDGEVCHGPDEVRAYFVKMMQGPDAIVKNVRLDFQVDRLTDLYANTGLAFGSSNDHYTLASGMDFQVQTRWTCALVRHEGRWRIAAFQAAPSVFDNPILAKSKRAAQLAGGGVGLAGGLLVGALVAVLARRRRP